MGKRGEGFEALTYIPDFKSFRQNTHKASNSTNTSDPALECCNPNLGSDSTLEHGYGYTYDAVLPAVALPFPLKNSGG